MGILFCPDAAAAVQRLTSGQFRLETDGGCDYLVNAGTSERTCIAQSTNDSAPVSDASFQRILRTFSHRERQVFGMIGNGMGMEEIAAQLGRSVKTIETY